MRGSRAPEGPRPRIRNDNESEPIIFERSRLHFATTLGVIAQTALGAKFSPGGGCGDALCCSRERKAKKNGRHGRLGIVREIREADRRLK